MLDDVIVQSFDLDYEIFNTMQTKFKYYSENLETPRLYSNDIFKEFENYVKATGKIFDELMRLFKICDDQRMKFRMLIIKMSKDRVQVDKFFQEEDETLVLQKLSIHSELKDRIIDKHLDTIIKKEELLNFYKSDLLSPKINSLNATTTSTINSMRTSMDKRRLSIKMNNKKTALVNHNHTQSNIISQSPANLNHNFSSSKLDKTKSIFKTNKSKIYKSKESPMTSLNNTVNEDNLLKRVLNMDFNTEKYNIISASPIQSPKANSKDNKNYQISSFNKQINNEYNTMRDSTFGINNKPILNKKGNYTKDLSDNSTGRNTSSLVNSKMNKRFISRSIDCDISYETFLCNTQGDATDNTFKEEPYHSVNFNKINSRYDNKHTQLKNNPFATTKNSISSSKDFRVDNFNSEVSSRNTSTNKNNLKDGNTLRGSINNNQTASAQKRTHLKSLISISKEFNNFGKVTTGGIRKNK